MPLSENSTTRLWGRVILAAALATKIALWSPAVREGLPLLAPARAEAAVMQASSTAGIGGYGLPVDESSLVSGVENARGETDASGGTLAATPESALTAEEFLRAPPVLYSSYEIVHGDMIGKLAENWGLDDDTLISVNGIKNTRAIYPGDKLKVPNQSGILYTTKEGDTLDSIAEKYEINAAAIVGANELFSRSALPDCALFLPGAKMDQTEKQEINGDLFIWPVPSHTVTSYYGGRSDPFGGKKRQFHTGIDIRAPMGTPVKAAMSGRVVTTSWSDVYGNYIVISHHSGYKTLYGHLSKIRVKSGSYVGMGQIIGSSGSTGYSTGPHLHFTVYKNGRLVNPRRLMGAK